MGAMGYDTLVEATDIALMYNTGSILVELIVMILYDRKFDLLKLYYSRT